VFAVTLRTELHYSPGLANPVQRGLQVVGETKAGSWLFQKTLYRLDRPLYRWTDGKVTVPGIAIGIPVILLTTTGAKSGLPRTMPVMGVPVGDSIAIMGTNYGQPKAPAWVFNLEAAPKATVTWRDRSIPVTARPATDDEREKAWTNATRLYRGFGEYRKRITERPVRIFVLEAAS
jgi:deazaflavin-dependent oxidoreductase (nitroreductase family)